MAKKKAKNPVSEEVKKTKKRIRKVQRKAKTIGLLYLLMTIVVTAAACLPLVAVEGVTLGVMEFWKPFTQLADGIKGKEIVLAVSVLYAIMLLVLVINVIRSFAKLGWLFKNKASRLYGFNRNM